MNISQARSLLQGVKKITKKRCGACGGKRVFAIMSESGGGWVRHYVRVSCSCGEMLFKDFDR